MGKGKKKYKKKSSNRKKHKSSKYQSTSDSSSSSEDEWVEQGSGPSICTSQPQLTQKEDKKVDSAESEDLFMNAELFPCITRKEIQQSKERKNDEKEDYKYMLDKLGQTDRELNPYWKDGGSGLPSERPETLDTLRQASVTVGDQGVAWLQKALQRAKEQATEQKRPLEEVVAERWGSLEKLENMIAAAEEREKSKQKFSHGRKYRYDEKDVHKSRHERYNKNSSNENKWQDDGSKDSKFGKNSRNNDKIHNKHERRSFARPKESSDDSSDEKNYKNQNSSSHRKSKRYVQPIDSNSEDDKYIEIEKNTNKCSAREYSKTFSSNSDDERQNRKTSYDRNDELKGRRKESKKTFMKPSRDSEDDSHQSPERMTYKQYKSQSSSSRGWRKNIHSSDKVEKVEKLKSPPPDKPSPKVPEKSPVIEEVVLTDKEMNELGAKLVKAELLGDQELASELKAKLEKAREAKANNPTSSEQSAEVVILTHTDAKGFTRPVSLGGPLEPSGGRRKAKKVDTHSEGKRMRYFADDDKYSLQEMFQREKMSTVEDSNEVFAKLASKGVGRDDSARDMEDVFEETARMEEAEGRKQARDMRKAIERSKQTARCLDNCQWCLESKEMLKHLIVAIGNTCYLCVPPYQSLTDNHCLIVPTHHTPCATQLDEDVWREIQDFRKGLVQMFLSLDEDVVFFESARYLNKFPHMVINCVSMPKETGDLAPIYFKKAIQECEKEWSNNKKLVDLKGRDVRRAVPKGLPYFAVDFGMDSGFAHVIEDEKLFPQNFAQEVIGGMLDLDHTVWRKQRRQTFEEQSKKVIQLTKLWNPFDCTKNK